MARRALMHGMRRRILRILNQDQAPRSFRDLSGLFPDASLSQVNYHVLVLADCGSVVVASGGTLTRSFASAVAANPQFAAILRATETLDDSQGPR